jgi:hypothetical protein
LAEPAGSFSAAISGPISGAIYSFGAKPRGYQEFRVRAGMMGAKEPRHAATQRAWYP